MSASRTSALCRQPEDRRALRRVGLGTGRGTIAPAHQPIRIPRGRLQAVPVRAGLAITTIRPVAPVGTILAIRTRGARITRVALGPGRPGDSGVAARLACRTGRAGRRCHRGASVSRVALVALRTRRPGDGHGDLGPIGQALDRTRRVRRLRGAALRLDLCAQRPYIGGQCRDRTAAQVRLGCQLVRAVFRLVDLQECQGETTPRNSIPATIHSAYRRR